MKTNYINIIIVIIAFATLSSCSDWLKSEPEGKIALDAYWKSENDVNAVVASCYRAMIEEDYTSRIMVWGEFRSDNISCDDALSVDLIKALEANILPDNVYSNWSSFYSVINYCNIVLHYATTVTDPNFTSTELHAKEAEVLTIRALTYFYLVRAFKNVPLILEPSISDSQNFNIGQSTEDEVLDKLEADLLLAEKDAMTTYGNSKYDKGLVTKNTVRALLADIYLWRNKYTECVTYCDKLLSNPNYKLIKSDLDPFKIIFNKKNSTESIFELQFDENNNYYNQAIIDYYGSPSSNINGQFFVPVFIAGNPATPDASTQNSVFVNTPITNITDVRQKDYIDRHGGAGVARIFKYTGDKRSAGNDAAHDSYYYRSPSNPPNWIVYRITDIMLMKAECLAQMDRDNNDRKSLVHLVNVVSSRSNPTVTDTLKAESFTNKIQLEELVLLERQRELMFEGKRWFDLLRMARRGNNTKRLTAKVIRKFNSNMSMISSKMTDMNSMYWPVNETELKTNTKLVQNPYYLLNIKH